MNSSFLLKSLVSKPLTSTARHSQLLSRICVPAMPSAPNPVQLRSYHDNSSQDKEDDPIFPVYIHHVSKIVLQHLQDSRGDWLMDQGLDRGLQIKSNGTFLLNFPARKGHDAGRIWTSYDSSTRQHWLSVYRQKFNAKFLLKKSGPNVPSVEAQRSMAEINPTVIAQIRAAVDQMVRQTPPNLQQTSNTNGC